MEKMRTRKGKGTGRTIQDKEGENEHVGWKPTRWNKEVLLAHVKFDTAQKEGMCEHTGLQLLETLDNLTLTLMASADDFKRHFLEMLSSCQQNNQSDAIRSIEGRNF